MIYTTYMITKYVIYDMSGIALHFAPKSIHPASGSVSVISFSYLLILNYREIHGFAETWSALSIAPYCP